MIPTIDPRLHVVFLAGSALLTGAFTLYAVQNRNKPGATWLAATLAATTIWTATYAAGLVTHNPTIRPYWEHVQWIGSGFLSLFFLLFALEYTGHDRIITRRNVALLAVVPTLSVLLVWTNRWHGLMWAENDPVVQDGLATMSAEFGPLFWPILAYQYVLIVVGGVLLLRLAVLSDYLYTDQSVLLFVGLVVPLVGNVVAVFFDTSPPGLDLTPYGFVVWGLALTATVYRQRLFQLVPATRRLGRSTAIRQLEDGIVIVDDDRRIVYLNDAAASILDCTPSAVVGDSIDSVVETLPVELGPGDVLAEFEREDRRYEVRASTITDRRERDLGHTLVLHDVTARHRREQRLASQRDELKRLDELNAAIRGVNQALVSATSDEEIHRAVCERLAETELYDAACVGDVQTWNGDAERWVSAGSPDVAESKPSEPVELPTGDDAAGSGTVSAGSWTVVPIVYGRTVYGALGVQSARERIPGREREVLAEVGELVGHALEAVENEQLLSSEAVVEVELESVDDEAPLAVASGAAECHLDLEGVVPSADDGTLAFVAVEGTPVEQAHDALANGHTDSRVVQESDDGGLLELTLPEETLLGTLEALGANVKRAEATDGTATYVIEVLSNAGVRRLLGRIEESFPDTRLEAKRERTRSPEPLEESLDGHSEELTDRQQEALEAAYRAGYFAWPRESTAEEVADSFGVSPATLHGHLRKAEQTVFDQLFEEPDADRPE